MGLIRNVIAKFDVVAKRRIQVETAIDASLYGDEVKLADTLGNLIENALNDAPDSKVRVKIAPCHPFLEIVVADDGPGLSDCDRRVDATERSGATIALKSYAGHGTLSTLRFASWERNVGLA